MSAAVDGKGNRIDTDILVCGYIREKSKQYGLSIPSDINSICFLFWLIKVCDEWDSKYASKYIKIDGQTVRSLASRSCISTYGCHSIDKGSYCWEMEVKQIGLAFLLVGLVEDTPNNLQKCQESCDYVAGHGCVLYSADGKFSRGTNEDCFTKKYAESFEKEQNVGIRMILDMDNHTLSFNVNSKDYGIATDKLDKRRYRMLVGFVCEQHEVELL